MTRIEMTIISSSSVKPLWRARGKRGRGETGKREGATSSLSPFTLLPFSPAPLPVTVLLPVERLGVGLRAHVENIFGGRLTAIVRVGVARAQAPLALARDGVDGNLPEVDLLLRREHGVV